MSSPIHLFDLPNELFHMIFSHLPRPCLKSIALTNRALQRIVRPFLFREVKVTFSQRGLEMLQEISKSSIAPHVRSLTYEAIELVDPYVQNLEYFKACIYTPEEYRRDRSEFNWDHTASELSYISAQKYFSMIAQDQHQMLLRRRDIATFERCVKRLPNLSTFRLSFYETQNEKYYWFTNRVYVNWKDSFSLHLETMMKALRSAQDKTTPIRSVEICGFYAGLSRSHTELLALANECLSGITRIALVDSFSLLNFLTFVELPSMRQLDLVHCGLVASDLDEFMQIHGEALQTVRLQRVMVYEGMAPLSPRLQMLRFALPKLSQRIRGLHALPQVTMNIPV